MHVEKSQNKLGDDLIMKIAIGCDHGGFELKNEIIKFLESESMRLRILVHIQQVLAIIRILHYQ